MKRHLIPGAVDRHGRARPAATKCCNGECNQGRACPVRESELSNVVPLRPEFPAPPFGITGGRVPLLTRAKRFGAALLDFLTAPCFRL